MNSPSHTRDPAHSVKVKYKGSSHTTGIVILSNHDRYLDLREFHAG